MKSVVVFCGSSTGRNPRFVAEARVLGQTLAERHMTLVYGGARVGVMGALAAAVLDHGGQVTGIIPDFLMGRETYHENLTELLITKSMHERKLAMFERSDGIITLPGGYGTLEEFFEMITWGQLGLHQKPMGLLNTAGFYDPLLRMLEKMVDQGFLAQAGYESLLVDKTVQGLLVKMEAYRPGPVPKWMGKNQV